MCFILGLWLLGARVFHGDGRSTRDPAETIQAHFTSPLSSTSIPVVKASHDGNASMEGIYLLSLLGNINGSHGGEKVGNLGTVIQSLTVVS